MLDRKKYSKTQNDLVQSQEINKMFPQLNIIQYSPAREHNAQVKSQHLYLEVYLQKASSIISNYHFMMRKSHSLKQHNRSLSEAEEISGAIVFFISLGPRSLLLSQKMRSSLRCCGGEEEGIKVRRTSRCIMQEPRVFIRADDSLEPPKTLFITTLLLHTSHICCCLFVWEQKRAAHLTTTHISLAKLTRAALWLALMYSTKWSDAAFSPAEPENSWKKTHWHTLNKKPQLQLNI